MSSLPRPQDPQGIEKLLEHGLSFEQLTRLRAAGVWDLPSFLMMWRAAPEDASATVGVTPEAMARVVNALLRAEPELGAVLDGPLPEVPPPGVLREEEP